jgi:hypothetical protein
MIANPISVPFYDLSNSLTAVKRKEKELNIFEDFPGVNAIKHFLMYGRIS